MSTISAPPPPTKPTPDAAVPADRMVPVCVATLMPAAAVGLDLFQLSQSGRLSLYRGGDFPLTDEDLARLRDRGIRRLFISESARGKYQRYLRRLVESDNSASFSITARVGAMSEIVRDILQGPFEQGDTDATLQAAGEVVSVISNVVSRPDFHVSDLFEVLHHDFTTFNHSTNVAIYAATLASHLGFDETQQEQIAIGGLIHDIGKLEIPEDILCKPGRLEPPEFETIKTHPTVAFRRLVGRTNLCEGQLMMAYQHHERLDGAGYPVGSTGDEIHPWAKLCCIVDVFEALTSVRPYREPMAWERALELQSRDVGTLFDPEMFACWNTITRQRLTK